MMTIEEKHSLMERVDRALSLVRPHLAVDGGDVEVVDITDERCAEVRWLGACESCSMSVMTMRAGIEQTIKMNVPEITRVVAVNGLLR